MEGEWRALMGRGDDACAISWCNTIRCERTTVESATSMTMGHWGYLANFCASNPYSVVLLLLGAAAGMHNIQGLVDV